MVASTQYDPEYVPVRGDVVWINLNPQTGNEIMKRRPALVLSSSDFNYWRKLAVVCPITSRVRASSFDVAVPAGLKVYGFIRVDQIKCLDWQARRAVFEDEMPDDIVEEVSTIVEAIIWAD